MRTIIYIVLFYLVYKLVKEIFLPMDRGSAGGAEAPGASEAPDKGEEMVFDTVCESYVPRDTALTVRDGDKVFYFCDSGCRDRFIKSLKG